jgi:hypothetical protein
MSPAAESNSGGFSGKGGVEGLPENLKETMSERVGSIDTSGPSMGARIPVLLLGITPSFEKFWALSLDEMRNYELAVGLRPTRMALMSGNET